MDIHLILNECTLSPGNYSIALTITSENLGKVLYKHIGIGCVRVTGDFYVQTPILFKGNWSVNYE